MAVLLYLAQANGAVVPALELKENIWKDTHVIDEVVKRCVSQIRAAFDDDARRQQVIATVPKKGYKIVGSIEWQGDEAEKTKIVVTSWHYRWLAVSLTISLFIVIAILVKSTLFSPGDTVMALPISQPNAE